MRMSYGPPGHKGVTQLMAVGADEYPSSRDKAATQVAVASGAVWALGLLIGSNALRGLGAGGAAASLAIRWLARR